MSEGSWTPPAHASTPPDAVRADAPPRPVARQSVTILNDLGLHLRPAEKFVSLARRFQAEIQVFYNGRELNGGSILDLIGSAAEKGARLDLVASGPDAQAALDALSRLVHHHFYEAPDGTPLPEPEDLFPPLPPPPLAPRNSNHAPSESAAPRDAQPS